ncbi:acyl-CoA synthetase [Pseudonocardia halophobica]|uniref:Long-chain-fatty-acid--CoA ligase n=1 Tax=Pseudonocardia halophobica TaxID=29401 RepID=A0A9W6L2F1_9PSEU|nr:AMP-binding protein [Pseudonocardia halophobica]GLL11793.1 long-chain-fatty-acid--CoA ligase [Pseudonocardia halophobica]
MTAAADRPVPPVLGGAAVPDGLLARAHAAAAELARRDVREGGRVALEGSGDLLAWFLGADLLGAATLVIEPRWTARERTAVLDDARPDLVVRPTATEPGPATTPAGDGRTPFYLPTTSGSSGRPTVLQRSRDSWLRSFAALGPVPGPVLIAGPLSSSLFLFGALHALWCGAELRLGRAADARAAATTHVVPAMLADLVATQERAPAESALRTVVCGGAHLGDGLRARFRQAFPAAELVEYYGSAEHSLVAVRRGDGLRPVPGVDLDVRDGTLWVRSPLAADGALRAGRLEPAGAWTTVGDRVDLHDGLLTVHGRGSAVISSGGRLVAAEEVETVLREVPGVDDVVVTGTPHARLGALVTAVVEGEPPLAELRAAARHALEPGKRPRVWLRAKALPRTASGKPARAVIADELAAGTLGAERLR